jgi:hypothetical protein
VWHLATWKSLACVGDSPALSPPTKLQSARIMHFAEQVAPAKAKILSVIQANSEGTFLPHYWWLFKVRKVVKNYCFCSPIYTLLVYFAC